MLPERFALGVFHVSKTIGAFVKNVPVLPSDGKSRQSLLDHLPMSLGISPVDYLRWG
jgi:hypothetical protein